MKAISTKKDNVRVVPFKMPRHKGSYVPSYGFRIEYDGYSVVISGDTSYSENLIKYSDGVDLLIHEVVAAPLDRELSEYIEFVLSIHTVPEECGRIFSKIRPKLAVYNHILLILLNTHFSPWYQGFKLSGQSHDNRGELCGHFLKHSSTVSKNIITPISIMN